jgi:hypothetical protein
MTLDEKCYYRRSYEARTTTFEGVGPDHKLYGCTTCDGQNIKCMYYATPQSLRLSKAQREIRERYPGIFGVRTEGSVWP